MLYLVYVYTCLCVHARFDITLCRCDIMYVWRWIVWTCGMRAYAHSRALATYSNIRLLILNKVLNSFLFLSFPPSFSPFCYFISSLFFVLYSLLIPELLCVCVCVCVCYFYLNNNDLTSECFFFFFLFTLRLPKIIYHINSLTLETLSLPIK